jgi:hypothetical protein
VDAGVRVSPIKESLGLGGDGDWGQWVLTSTRLQHARRVSAKLNLVYLNLE